MKLKKVFNIVFLCLLFLLFFNFSVNVKAHSKELFLVNNNDVHTSIEDYEKLTSVGYLDKEVK